MGNARYAIGMPFQPLPTTMLTNGDFGTNVSGWTAYGNGVVASWVNATGALNSTGYLKALFTPGTLDNVGAYQTVTATFKNGRTYAASAYIYSATGASRTATMRLKSSGGTVLATATFAMTSASTWYHFGVNATLAAADTAMTLEIYVSAGASGAGEEVRIDRARLFLADDGRDGGDFVVPVDMAIIGGTAVAGYPYTNMRTENLQRTARFTLATTQVAFDFGVDVAADALFIENLNTTSIRYATMVGGWSGTVVSATPNVSANQWTGRRSILGTMTSPASTRFWKLQYNMPAALARTDETYFEVGRICFVRNGGLHTIAQNWGLPYRMQVEELGLAARYPGGTTVDKSMSLPYMTLALSQNFQRNKGDSVETDIARFVAMRNYQRVLHFENWDSGDTNKTRAYLCKKSGPVGADYTQFPIMSVDVGLEEVT